MAKKQKNNTSVLKKDIQRLSSKHYLLAASYALSIILLDAWNVITSKIVLQRWTMLCVLVIGVSIVWYASRALAKSSKHLRMLVYGLIGLDIFFATYGVFYQRGIASKSVIFFTIPIAVSAVLRSRSAIYTTAVISISAYALAVVRYFYTYPGEGYKAEMYSELFFYSAILLVIAGILGIVVHAKNE